MKKMFVFILMSLFLFSGCETLQKKPIESFNVDELKAKTLTELCFIYYNTNSRNLFTDKSRLQLETNLRLKGFPENEISSIKENKLYIGSSIYAMYAVYGKPFRQNITTNRYGTSIQHVYRPLMKNDFYCYTDDEILTSIQY